MTYVYQDKNGYPAPIPAMSGDDDRYQYVHRGDMWFGNVYDVYKNSSWIGGLMQGKQGRRWSAVTPSGRGAEALPFEHRQAAASWLDGQGETVPRGQRWRYDHPWYSILGVPGMAGFLEQLERRPLLHYIVWASIAVGGIALAVSLLESARHRMEPREAAALLWSNPSACGCTE